MPRRTSMFIIFQKNEKKQPGIIHVMATTKYNSFPFMIPDKGKKTATKRSKAIAMKFIVETYSKNAMKKLYALQLIRPKISPKGHWKPM